MPGKRQNMKLKGKNAGSSVEIPESAVEEHEAVKIPDTTEDSARISKKVRKGASKPSSEEKEVVAEPEEILEEDDALSHVASKTDAMDHEPQKADIVPKRRGRIAKKAKTEDNDAVSTSAPVDPENVDRRGKAANKTEKKEDFKTNVKETEPEEMEEPQKPKNKGRRLKMQKSEVGKAKDTAIGSMSEKATEEEKTEDEEPASVEVPEKRSRRATKPVNYTETDKNIPKRSKRAGPPVEEEEDKAIVKKGKRAKKPVNNKVEEVPNASGSKKATQSNEEVEDMEAVAEEMEDMEAITEEEKLVIQVPEKKSKRTTKKGPVKTAVDDMEEKDEVPEKHGKRTRRANKYEDGDVAQPKASRSKKVPLAADNEVKDGKAEQEEDKEEIPKKGGHLKKVGKATKSKKNENGISEEETGESASKDVTKELRVVLEHCKT